MNASQSKAACDLNPRLKCVPFAAEVPRMGDDSVKSQLSGSQDQRLSSRMSLDVGCGMVAFLAGRSTVLCLPAQKRPVAISVCDMCVGPV